MSKQAFLKTDAWLLGAIFWARRAEGTATLAQIIAYGDALHHAIFNPEEIESGLARLASAGVIREEAESFAPGPAGEPWFEEFNTVTLRTIESLDWFAEKLSAGRYPHLGNTRNNLRYPGFTKQRYDEAIAEYRRWTR